MVAGGWHVVQGGGSGAWAGSTLLPYLSRHSAYETYLDSHGLAVESLLREAGLFDRVQAGLAVLCELRASLDGCFMEVVHWADVEVMWIFSGAAEAGLPLDGIEPRELRKRLGGLHQRVADRMSLARHGEIDLEAALCALVSRLVAWDTQPKLRLADVWKRGTGVLERMLKGGSGSRAALEPEHELALVLDSAGVEYLQQRIARAG
ncbi:hypothetical protein [Ramlibacter albus]|uniref:Uncharacterized protein n=1 Tax=Ramlibacter albus TaxID=2079448 RepID=A0A923S515_9BURK|nr:hypothetical protein [Ramlibacter albus]MBC5768051.1 hypothetical protein [Ramlibacter albus]